MEILLLKTHHTRGTVVELLFSGLVRAVLAEYAGGGLGGLVMTQPSGLRSQASGRKADPATESLGRPGVIIFRVAEVRNG